MVTFTADWSAEAAEKATRDWLRILRNADVPRCMIGAQNDDMAMGARRALMNEGGEREPRRVRRIRVTGCMALRVRSAVGLRRRARGHRPGALGRGNGHRGDCVGHEWHR